MNSQLMRHAAPGWLRAQSLDHNYLFCMDTPLVGYELMAYYWPHFGGANQKALLLIHIHGLLIHNNEGWPVKGLFFPQGKCDHDPQLLASENKTAKLHCVSFTFNSLHSQPHTQIQATMMIVRANTFEGEVTAIPYLTNPESLCLPTLK